MTQPIDFTFYRDRLTTLLLDQPVGTSAEFNDYSIAFYNGAGVVGLLLREDDSNVLDEEYDLEFAWNNWQTDLLDWLAEPKYAQRPELLDWIRREIV